MQTLWFDQISLKDIALVGGKNASLGEMYTNLKKYQIPIPYGFAITTNAYDQFLVHNKLSKKINKLLIDLDHKNIEDLEDASKSIIKLFNKSSFPDILIKEISDKFKVLQSDFNAKTVAVRSSASLEDLSKASFAGQQETFLHVENLDDVLEKTKNVFSSLFLSRAISYRIFHGFDHFDVKMSVGIQKMCNSDNKVSGVMFTIDPESGFKDSLFINASYGLGESIVQGIVNPDEYIIYKPFLLKNNLVVLNKKLGSKETRLVYNKNLSKKTLKEEKIPKNLQDQFCLKEKDLKILSNYGLIIEKHYGKAMDIEWAQDEDTDEIFILQARPETIHNKNANLTEDYYLEKKGPILSQGRSVGKRIGQGKARILFSLKDANTFNKGEVLVTDMTDPNWEPVMQKASAIVTNRGGRTCHAAIIARELGLPCVVGCIDATKTIKDQSLITVSCAEGDTGYIYEGLLPIKKEVFESKRDKDLDFSLMLIAANPEKAFSYANLPQKGIGLMRLEFIIQNSIGIHPNALINFSSLEENLKVKIIEKIKEQKSYIDFYKEVLARGIMRMSASVYPFPSIVRLSDFKTNEYEELLGGYLYEPKENNPMLGFRGACRYISPFFKEAFSLECQAIRRARENGFSNIWVLVPFVRTLDEAKLIINALKEEGLESNKDNLKILMMCEIPNNVILALEFLQYFDGFSIGSNDLTQLTLGIDRDNEKLAYLFSESDKGMLKMFDLAIDACKKLNKYIGFCGQGPSDDLNLAYFLKNAGIDSISLSPDSITKVYDELSKSQ